MTAQQRVDETKWAEAAVAAVAAASPRPAMGARDHRRRSQVVVGVVARGLLAVMALLVALHPDQALAKTRAKAKRPARADKHVCVESYNKAKESLQSGRLIEVKEPLGRCARAVCGKFLQKECTTLYLQMDADIPSVVPLVVDAAATPGAAFEVRMDGELVTSKLDGIAIPVNPGWHEFTFSTEDRIFATRKILVAQGQRNLAISVSLRSAARKTVDATDVVPTKAPHPKTVALEEPDSDSDSIEPAGFKRKARVSEAPPEAGTSWGAYALGGVGLVGLGGAALFTYWGRQDNSALRSACAPDCNPSSVHHIRMLYLAADAAAATGVAALIASTWLFLHARNSEETSAKQMARLRLLDVRPSASGAYATVGGTF
jgi:hypothetical protein